MIIKIPMSPLVVLRKKTEVKPIYLTKLQWKLLLRKVNRKKLSVEENLHWKDIKVVIERLYAND